MLILHFHWVHLQFSMTLMLRYVIDFTPLYSVCGVPREMCEFTTVCIYINLQSDELTKTSTRNCFQCKSC